MRQITASKLEEVNAVHQAKIDAWVQEVMHRLDQNKFHVGNDGSLVVNLRWVIMSYSDARAVSNALQTLYPGSKSDFDEIAFGFQFKLKVEGN